MYQIINLANIFIFTNQNAKIVFPKSEDNDLFLTQHFLNIQIYLIPDMAWSIQIGISDQNKVQNFSYLDKKTCGIF